MSFLLKGLAFCFLFFLGAFGVQAASLRSSPVNSCPAVRITEHAIPNAVHPGGITVAHNGFVWFTGNPSSGGTGFIVRYRANAFSFFQQISDDGNDIPEGVFDPIVEGPDNALYFAGYYARPGLFGVPVSYLRATFNGQMTALGGYGDTTVYDLTFGPDKGMYAALQLSGFPTWPSPSGAVDTSHGLLDLPDKDQNGVLYPKAMTTGEDGSIWVAATFPAGDSPTAAFLYRISTAGAITARYRLANNSQPGGIVWGPDDALWYTEYGTNRIGRITTAGRNIEYAIPTPNSGPQRITVGGDGALWFTEFRGNKVGRITTAGRISEYAVPTRNSGPTYIAGPFGAEGAPCCLNRTLWFSESNANKIAELHF